MAQCIAYLMMFLFLLTSPAAAQQVVDRIVAVVNGEMITLGEINAQLAKLQDQLPLQPSLQAQEAMLQQVRESLLQARINEILIKHEVERLKLDVTPADIESHIRTLRDQRGMTEEDLRAQLALQGKTRAQLMDEVKQEILRQQLINYMVHRKVVITDKEIDDYLASGGSAPSPALPSATPSAAAAVNTSRVHLAVIMVPTEALAAQVYKEVTSGKISFAEAAKKHSVGPAAEEGGDMGTMAMVDLGAALRKSLEGLKPGDVSKPFRLDASFALVRLLEQGPAASAAASLSPSLPTSDYDREAIREQLKRVRTEAMFKEFLERLKGNALIKINW